VALVFCDRLKVCVSIALRCLQGRGAHNLNLKAKLVTAGPGAGDMVLCRTVATPNDRATGLVAQRTLLEVARSGISDPTTGRMKARVLRTMAQR